MAKNTSCGVQLRIRGKVQGVGFRPFVWQLAVVLSFILTLLLGFEDIPVEEAAAQARKYQSVQPTVAKEVSLN